MAAEDGAGWLAFFRDLTARDLTGVRLVTSDAHHGLVAAISEADVGLRRIVTFIWPLRPEASAPADFAPRAEHAATLGLAGQLRPFECV